MSVKTVVISEINSVSREPEELLGKKTLHFADSLSKNNRLWLTVTLLMAML